MQEGELDPGFLEMLGPGHMGRASSALEVPVMQVASSGSQEMEPYMPQWQSESVPAELPNHVVTRLLMGPATASQPPRGHSAHLYAPAPLQHSCSQIRAERDKGGVGFGPRSGDALAPPRAETDPWGCAGTTGACRAPSGTGRACLQCPASRTTRTRRPQGAGTAGAPRPRAGWMRTSRCRPKLRSSTSWVRAPSMAGITAVLTTGIRRRIQLSNAKLQWFQRL